MLVSYNAMIKYYNVFQFSMDQLFSKTEQKFVVVVKGFGFGTKALMRNN